MLIAAVGISKSGKTTTLEFLITNLTREGYDVATIKHIHQENFTIDKEGTNTYRFSKAGSRFTVAFSSEEVAIIKKTKTSLNDLDRIIEYLENEGVDIILIEGFHGYISKRTDIFKIVTAKTPEDLERTLNNCVAPILAITGVIRKTQVQLKEIPYIDLPKDGPKLLEIVKKHLPSSQNR